LSTSALSLPCSLMASCRMLNGGFARSCNSQLESRSGGRKSARTIASVSIWWSACGAADLIEGCSQCLALVLERPWCAEVCV
jgi:hypothetical protein